MVIATGPYQKPVIPDAAGLGDVFQASASAYRDPASLPRGGVLVVGAGASGCQIAEELLREGRPVFLAVGPHRRIPRRFRGKDIIWWIRELGLDERVADEVVSRQAPLLISGAYGGRTVDLRRYAAEGMTLLGRFRAAEAGVASFADDMAETLAKGDESFAGFIRTANEYAARKCLSFPEEADPPEVFPDPSPAMDTLDLRAAGIGTVIWATGYRYDFGWIDLDVFAPSGVPAHRRGVTSLPGAYFLGLPLLHKMKSSFLSGVGEDADYLAAHIAARES